MGDKTQFFAMAYAARYSLRDVLLGILWGIAAVNLLSVALGSAIRVWIPHGYVEALSALCFFAFAIWTLRGGEDEGEVRETRTHPILAIGMAFFLAELGDKTMLTSATLAATYNWFPVWLGATSGLVCADGLAVWAGRSLGRKIPKNVMTWIASGLFFLFGCWYAVKAVAAFR